MNVGDAAHRSGLPAKTIRYYEEIGLIAPARAANGYRDYSGDDIHRLAFLRRARNLGFSIDDCRQLMALYKDRGRASHDVRAIAAAHVTAIEEKVRELQSMRSTLQKLVHACHGDERPDCPILDDMAGALVSDKPQRRIDGQRIEDGGQRQGATGDKPDRPRSSKPGPAS